MAKKKPGKNRFIVPDVPHPTEIITPSNDTPIGTTIDGYPLYERADGSVYRMRDGRPEFGGDLSPYTFEFG